MKSSLLTAALLLAGFANCGAFEHLQFDVLGNKYSVGLELYLGVSHFRMLEMVYRDSSGDRFLSKIDWDIGVQAGMGAGFFIGPADPYARFGVSLGGRCAWYFPANNRTVRDSDWDYDGGKFSYGESNASTLAGMEAEGSISAGIPIRNKWAIEAAGELWYSRYGAMAHGGWIRQVMPGEPWNNDAEKRQLYGVSMEYLQEWLVFAPGLGIKWKLDKGHIGARMAISPFIVGYHVDNHYFRKLDEEDSEQKYVSYTDNTKGGIYYKIQGEWFFDLTRQTQIGAVVDYRVIENARGDTTISTTGLAGHSFFDEGMAGAARRNLSIGLTLRTAL
jgi:outer membrane protease